MFINILQEYHSITLWVVKRQEPVSVKVMNISLRLVKKNNYVYLLFQNLRVQILNFWSILFHQFSVIVHEQHGKFWYLNVVTLSKYFAFIGKAGVRNEQQEGRIKRGKKNEESKAVKERVMFCGSLSPQHEASSRYGWRRRPPFIEGSCEYTE
jgi:hypothetical protein